MDDSFRAAWHGLELVKTVRAVDNHLRDRLKYSIGKPSADTRAAWEAMRAHLREAAAANGVGIAHDAGADVIVAGQRRGRHLAPLARQQRRPGPSPCLLPGP